VKIKLHPNESLRSITRQSKWVLTTPTLALIASILFAAVSSWTFTFFGIPIQFFIIAIAASWFLRELSIYNLNVFLITSERLIVVFHEGFLKKEVYETPHERILNISYNITGPTQSLGGYGNVDVHIIGLAQPLVLKNVAKPAQLKDDLWRIHTSKGLKTGLYQDSALIDQFTKQNDSSN
jgi:hypothetical protein